jgi:hypothetical protein
MIISPFATDDGLERVAPAASQSIQVVSRIEDLERLNSDSLHRLATCFIIDDVATLKEDDDPAAPVGLLAGLHAKTYVIEKGREARVLLGSSNATNAAFNGNIEFLVELVGSKTKLGIDTFLAPDAPFRQMLTEYRARGGEQETDDNRADYVLESALRATATLRFKAEVHTEHALYTMHITSLDTLTLPQDVTATIGLLTRSGDVFDLESKVDASIPGLTIVDITPFLVLRLTDGRDETRSTVLKAELAGDPPGRRDELLARQFDTMEKFLHFLALLLALGSPIENSSPEGAGTIRGGWSVGHLGVFEALIRALGSGSSALIDLEPLVSRLQNTEAGKQVLPAGFDDLWDLVWKAQQILARKAS